MGENIVVESRQQILLLVLGDQNLASSVIAWSFYDGSCRRPHGAGDTEMPPYASVLDAMRDGWRVVQFPPPVQHAGPETEFELSVLKNAYYLEKLVPLATGGSIAMSAEAALA